MLRQERLIKEDDTGIAVLSIRNFSCIKNLDVEFKRLTVFIGEQASGKSVTCKLYYFFTQAFRNVYANSLGGSQDFDIFKKGLEKEFHLIFPDSAWQNDTFRISWSVGNKKILISHGRLAKRIKVNCDDYKETYETALKGLSTNYAHKKHRGLFEDELDSRIWTQQFVSKSIRLLNLPSVDYIPAGRSFFSTIQENVFALLSDNIGIDYFLKEFGRKIEARRFRYLRANPDPSLQEHEGILHGVYRYDGKEQWIVRDQNHKVRLADASSGQQESFPLLLILSHLSHVDILRPRRIIIEEPEAHLFPTAQMEIVELLRKMMHQSQALGFVITTHSPFILCCLNNLIAKSKSIANAVSAYHLHDGVRDDLYDTDLRLINAERFDSISTRIANG